MSSRPATTFAILLALSAVLCSNAVCAAQETAVNDRAPKQRRGKQVESSNADQNLHRSTHPLRQPAVRQPALRPGSSLARIPFVNGLRKRSTQGLRQAGGSNANRSGDEIRRGTRTAARRADADDTDSDQTDSDLPSQNLPDDDLAEATPADDELSGAGADAAAISDSVSENTTTDETDEFDRAANEVADELDDDSANEFNAETGRARTNNPRRSVGRPQREPRSLLSGLPLLRGQAPAAGSEESFSADGAARNPFADSATDSRQAFRNAQLAQRAGDPSDISTWQPGVAPHQPWKLESVDPAEVYASDHPGIWSTDPSWTWQMLPVGILYGAYTAGEKESKLSSALLQEINGELWWDHVLGGRLGLVRYGNENPLRPEGFQLDVEAGAFLRMQPLNQLDVISTDFRFGLPLTYRRGKWQTKFGYYHISSHVGDEFQLKNPTFVRNNYARDALVFGMGYFPVDELRLYAEVGGAFHHIGGAQAWEVQTGFEYAQPQSTGFWPTPFYAVNGHFRQDVDWSGSLNVLAGIQWRSTTRQTLRIGLQYFNGANNQYVFLRDTQQLIGGTIRYDF